MASFMGLFRRWLDPSDEDNNNNSQQRQPTTTEDNHQQLTTNDGPERISEVPRFQLETERDEVFQSAIEELQAELRNSKGEAIALQRQHIDALATKESEHQTLSRELITQIDALNNRLMVERRKSEQRERTSEDDKTRQQQQLQMQRNNTRQLKELHETIVKQEVIVTNERAENLKLRNEYQRVLDAKEAEGHRVSQQLKEVSRRLEDEVKVCVAEKKRRERADTTLETQTEIMKQQDEEYEEKSRQLDEEYKDTVKQLVEQYKDTVRQLDVVNESLEKQMKEREDERMGFHSMEKHYKETFTQKESDYGKLERCLATMKSTMQCRKREINSEKRKTKNLEQKISESKDQVLQVAKKHHQQLNSLKEKVAQLTKEVGNEKRKTTEVEKHRDEALTTNKLNRQKFNKDLTQLNRRLESGSKDLETEKQIRQELQIQLREQKEKECQKDRALEMEKKARKALQIQLREQKEVKCEKDKALKMEKKARETLQIQLQERKESECQKDIALEMEKKAREELHIQLQEQKENECQKDRALEVENKARKALQIQLQEQKENECQKDRASGMEKKAMEVLQIMLKEKDKAECQKEEQLQNSLKQLSDYGVEILFLSKELETQRQKNVLSDNDHHERVKRANDDCQQLLATVAELQNRLENQAKNLLMERQKKEGLERQFQWQSEVLKHNECQLGITRKELQELKELFSHREIELSNERLQKAYTDVDHLTVIAVKDKACQELEKQLTEARETLASQTQLLANENEKQEAAIRTFEDQLKRQIEMEKELKNQVMELEERLSALQTPGAKDEEKDVEGENLSSVGTDESPPQNNNMEDDVLENQKLFMELLVLQEKLEKTMEELDMERQTRLDMQEQTKQMMAERDTLMEKTAEENEKLTSRITELETDKRKLEADKRKLEADKRSGTRTSDNQNDQALKRDTIQPNETLNIEPDDSNTRQLIEQDDNEILSMRDADSLTKQREQMEVHLTPKAKQLDEQIKRISKLSTEKRKRLKLSTKSGHIPAPKHQLLLQPMQFVQQTITRELLQMPLKQNKPDFDPTSIRVIEDRRETLTASEDNAQSGNQVNWTIESSNGKATIDGEATEAGEEFTTTSNRLNPLRLDENRIQKFRNRLKTLQPLRDKVDADNTLPGILDNETQDKQQQDFLNRINEEPVTTKYEDNETEVDILPDEGEEDPPPKTKRRRIEEDLISTEVYYSAPYDRQTTAGMVRVIEIKPETDIKQEPLEEQNVRTPAITDSKNGSKERRSIMKQEPKEEREQGIKQEPKVVPVVINRKRLKAASTSTYRYLLPKPSNNIAADSEVNTSAAKNIESSAMEDPAVHSLSSPKDARLVHTLRPQSLTNAVTGVAVLNGSLFVVSEMNSVVEVYDSTTFTFSGKVSVEGLTNPQSLTSCPLKVCLYILDITKPNNAIYRLGLAPDWRHHKWPIGADFGALASTSSGTLLLSCFVDFRIKEFSPSGELIREFLFEQNSTSDLRLFGAVQLPRTSRTSRTAGTSKADEAQFAINYSHRRTGIRRVCYISTVDGKGQVADPLLKYNGALFLSQHLIVGHQSGALFLADFAMGEVLQWNAEQKNCRKMVGRKDSRFRPLRICLDKNDQRIIVAEVCLDNSGSSTMSGTNKLSVYDL